MNIYVTHILLSCTRDAKTRRHTRGHDALRNWTPRPPARIEWVGTLWRSHLNNNNAAHIHKLRKTFISFYYHFRLRFHAAYYHCCAEKLLNILNIHSVTRTHLWTLVLHSDVPDKFENGWLFISEIAWNLHLIFFCFWRGSMKTERTDYHIVNVYISVRFSPDYQPVLRQAHSSQPDDECGYCYSRSMGTSRKLLPEHFGLNQNFVCVSMSSYWIMTSTLPLTTFTDAWAHLNLHNLHIESIHWLN